MSDAANIIFVYRNQMQNIRGALEALQIARDNQSGFAGDSTEEREAYENLKRLIMEENYVERSLRDRAQALEELRKQRMEGLK